MTELELYLARINYSRKFFRNHLYYLTSASDREALRELAEVALEPENLTCDGELSADEVKEKQRFYTAVLQQLSEYRSSKGKSLSTDPENLPIIESQQQENAP